MSQPTRTKKGRPAPRQSPVPAIISALVVIGVFVLLGVMLASNRPGASQSAAQQTADAFSAVPTAAVNQAAPTALAAQPAGEKKTYSAAPPMTIDPKKNYTATITTPRGDIVIKLRPDLAPQTVNSFIFLARNGFYDGLTWHRVVNDPPVIQGGDPRGDGTGGPGYTVPAEFTDKVLFDRSGIVAMARSQDPDSGGSQFFITRGPATYLNSQYTVFGEVVQGQDIVDGVPSRDPATATTPGEQMLKVTVTEQ